MPIYEYQCKACDTRFEKLLSRERARLPAPCPRCESQETLRLLSLFAAATTETAEPCFTSQTSGTPCCRMVGGGCGLPPR